MFEEDEDQRITLWRKVCEEGSGRHEYSRPERGGTQV